MEQGSSKVHNLFDAIDGTAAVIFVTDGDGGGVRYYCRDPGERSLYKLTVKLKSCHHCKIFDSFVCLTNTYDSCLYVVKFARHHWNSLLVNLAQRD